MKNFARLLALLLVCISLLTLFAACDQAPTTEPTDDPEDDVALIDDAFDANGRLKDNLPKDLNFEGEEVRILYWKDADQPEFEQDTVTGDNVRDAVYDRNNQVQDRLNIEIVWYSQPGNGDNISSFVKHIENQYNTATQLYDIIAAYSRTTGMAAIHGYLYNMQTITENNYMDLKMPWWPQQLVDTVNFGDAYYFISGDMSTNVIYMMRHMYFNKDLFARYELENPYQLVYDGKWTMDKMIEMTSDRYQDLDRNNTISDADAYGFVACEYILSSYVIACNLRFIDDGSGDQDVLIISPDYGSRKMTKLLSKLGDWAATDSVRIHNGGVESFSTRVNVTQAFENNRALMITTHSAEAANYSSKDFGLGIVPNPKYNEQQINYYTGMGNRYSLYGIYVDFEPREGDKAATLSMFTAVMECWASEGYRLTTPEVFEVNMQLKYSEGQDETNMFEYIRSGITFDLGPIFDAYLNVISERPIKSAVCVNAPWSSSYQAFKVSIGAQLHQLCENFKVYQAERDNR